MITFKKDLSKYKKNLMIVSYYQMVKKLKIKIYKI